MMAKIEIKMTGPGRGHVYVDGKEVDVRGVSFCFAVDEPNIVTLDLLADEVIVEAEADVFSAATKAVIVR